MKEEVELDEKVAAYDKNGKVVGLYRNMADAKRLKPNHTYKIHKEETEENPSNSQHLCAKNVVHESWGEGSCIPTMHADPDEDGNIEWYDVMFDHGIEEQVSIEELKVTKAESHIHSSKKKIKDSDDEDDDDMEDDEDDSDEDEENGKKKKVSGKKDDVDVEPEMDETKMVTEKEMTPAQAKKREEIVLSMKKEMPRFKKKYGDRAKDVMYATATKMAMKEGFELGIEKSDLIEETELDEAKSGTGKILVADPKTQRVIKIDEKDWPKYEKKGWVQAESNDLDEGFINIGGAKVKDDEKSILQHIKKTFPNVNKVKKDPQHGWIPVFEELDLDEANVAKMSDDVLKSRLAQMKRAENSPAIQFEIKRLKKEMKKRNIQEESDLDEARGRPRKDGTTGGSEDRENIQMQLRKSVSLRGLKDVEFADGKKVKVSARDAQSILSKLDAIKAPKERQNAVIHIAKSHNNLVDFASGKSGEMDPEKRKVAFLKGLMKTK